MTGATGLSGGIARANLNVLHALADVAEAGGLALHVISLHEDDRHRPSMLPSGTIFLGCRGNKLLYALRVWRSLGRDTLYVFDHVRLAMPALPMMLAGLARVVVMAHGSESWRLLRRTSKWIFRRATLCLTNSQYTLRRMRETFDGFDATHCELGLPPSAAGYADAAGGSSRPDATVQSLCSVDGVNRPIGSRMLLLVGRMDSREREKGHFPLLQVWPRVVARYPHAQLVFAGPGDDVEALRGLAAERGVGASVFVPGFVEEKELQALYARCHAFVMPSRQEGFGLVYLEAMNHGKACVGCRGDGAEDVIIDEESGYLIDDPGDSAELYRVICRLYDDPQRTRDLGQRGLLRVHGHFSSASAQERIRDRISRLLWSR